MTSNLGGPILWKEQHFQCHCIVSLHLPVSCVSKIMDIYLKYTLSDTPPLNSFALLVLKLVRLPPFPLFDPWLHHGEISPQTLVLLKSDRYITPARPGCLDGISADKNINIAWFCKIPPITFNSNICLIHNSVPLHGSYYMGRLWIDSGYDTVVNVWSWLGN